MACSRCGGFLVVDEFMDAKEEYSRMWCQGLRCINCGAIDESLIRANRKGLATPRHIGSLAALRFPRWPQAPKSGRHPLGKEDDSP